MGDKVHILFKVVLVGAIYHLIRDILQIAGIQNIFTDIGHVDHEWCRSVYCDYVTLPVEIFIIIASTIILKRKHSGILGIIVIILLFWGLLMWVWP